MKSILKSRGVALISSTKSLVSEEGWQAKSDFNKKELRFRKLWTEKELEETIDKMGFKRLALQRYTDPFGKTWMDFVVRKK